MSLDQRVRMCRAANMLLTAAATAVGTQEEDAVVAEGVAVEAHLEIVGRVREVKAEREKGKVDDQNVMDAQHPAVLTGPVVDTGDPHVATEVVVIVTRSRVEKVVIVVMVQKKNADQ